MPEDKSESPKPPLAPAPAVVAPAPAGPAPANAAPPPPKPPPEIGPNGKPLVNCTINGVAMKVDQGTSIIEAMNQNQQAIAHYCWHPGLSVAGVCRMCMVEIAGNPRPQIACNTQVTEGMVVNNTSEKVKDAVKWGLDFHLINHPLDCPICDQAGECGLQDQYMQYGKYDPEMGERKVKKHKVVDLGPKVVLDSERCILCARCVRFTDEVSKTHELGIFNRGDRSEIGTVAGHKLDNKYSVNTVDICPVGALTSKDFRFKQRAWLLKDHNTICTGCSTGCNVKISFNKEGVFRVKPRYNAAVNGYWMCDEGRDVYKFLNKEFRLQDAQTTVAGKTEYLVPDLAARKVGDKLRALKTNGQAGSIGLVITGQHSNEELDAIVKVFKQLGTNHIYHWINNPEQIEEFDGLLLRGDKNPNTAGVKKTLSENGVAAQWSDLEKALDNGEIQTLVVAAPENQAVYPDLKARVQHFSKAKDLIWLGAGHNEAIEALDDTTMIPLKSFFEKEGTYINAKGLAQHVKPGALIVPQALTLTDVAQAFMGTVAAHTAADLQAKPLQQGRIRNEATTIRGNL